MAYYPKYQMVIDYITERINNKTLNSGDKIPSEKEFSEILGVSNITVRTAMSELVNSGTIYRIKGKGSFISAHAAREEKQPHRLVAFVYCGRSLSGSANMQLIISMQKYFLEHGFSLIIENTDEYAEDELVVVQRLMEKHVVGFIFFSEDPVKSIPCYRLLESNHVPFVLVDRYTPLYPANFVGSSNHDGAFASVRHLLRLKHTEVAFVACNNSLSSETERYEGYRDALISAGLPVDPDLLFTADHKEMERLVSHIEAGGITAVVTANDSCAIDVMNLFRQSGIHVPNDVSLVGFDDSDVLKHIMIPLTTVKQYFEDIGFSAAKLLVENINEKQHDYCHIRIGTRLILRESTKPNDNPAPHKTKASK